ncbi:hypothetical protein [Enterococcus mundtii]|uniref:hypothetical protein n=1 Tax=Enterococcus mundtii TaxID=53346 RepID=UPI001A95C04E|nr:hypothetical protein [Enterococcus mundtii]MBO1087134.1 hypothetical protein [Enterococcus mundtii]
MTMTFEELYNSAMGIASVWNFEDGYIDNSPNNIEATAGEQFDEAIKDLEENPDMNLLGYFDSTQEADEELQEYGFSLDQITKMNMSRYGKVIECLQDPDSGTYHVYTGAR